MPKQVCHSVEYEWKGKPNESGNYEVLTDYFCGKIGHYIRNDIEVRTPREIATHEKFSEDQKVNPWPLCKKCEKEKEKREKMVAQKGIEPLVTESKSVDLPLVD